MRRVIRLSQIPLHRFGFVRWSFRRVQEHDSNAARPWIFQVYIWKFHLLIGKVR